MDVSVIVAVVSLSVFIGYMLFFVNNTIKLNTFPSGSFLISSYLTPYTCLSTLNNMSSYVQCDPTDFNQQYTYDSSLNNIHVNASNCLVYDNNGVLSKGACNQKFFYNSEKSIIQTTSDVSDSTLFLSGNKFVNACFTTMNYPSYQLNSIPSVAFGPWYGRYVTISVSTINCLNYTSITVLSNPWDSANAALNASLTKSSDNLCIGTPWVTLDFGRTIPITQIVVIADQTPTSDRSLMGAVLSIADYNNIDNYTSDPISINASYSIFNPPLITPLYDIKSAKPLNCDMSASLYQVMYPTVLSKPWDNYQQNKTKNNWYGPSC